MLTVKYDTLLAVVLDRGRPLKNDMHFPQCNIDMIMAQMRRK